MGHTAVKTAATALGAVAAVGAGAFAWGSLVERNRFTVRHEVLPILEPGARSLTVLHLADIHLAPWQRGKQEWIRSLADLEPDLVVNTGDNLGHEDTYEALEYTLAPFTGAGVFVNGSNDYFGPTFKSPLRYFSGPSEHKQRSVPLDTARLENFFENELGWLSLNNTARAMSIKGSRLEFFGVNDAHRDWDKLGALPGAIEEMQENVEWPAGRPGQESISIGVTHAPYQRVLNSFVTNGANMIFAGHTHGGQVRVPGLPPLVTNCDIPRDQAQGLSVWNHARRAAYLNVSAGLGTSIYAPVRFACRPEAVVVTLTAGDFSYS
ncbi:putative MPP superfamily phosphohydrolase [Conyzicola lurida]|uniref:Putative MPP superfamily phosphohydrolase n=1 Tax=Conyzicola lurida TaxID=1172621 RepID=A0A841AKI0_9MICO|nr:putative MPP superfamily phosphohydrolase [Conyzicola lurida]